MRNCPSRHRILSATGALVIALVLSIQALGAETVLHSFAGPPTDGATPVGSLVRDNLGNLYGTTYTGGTHGAGTVFKIDSSNQETILHNFTGGPDGGFPAASLVFDNAGRLYGTAACGGNSSCSGGVGGNGVVFTLAPAGSFSVLYIFKGGANGDGSRPFAPLIFTLGNLYGTTAHGGIGNCATATGSGCGIIFTLTPSGNETVLYRFTGGADGGRPLAPLVFDQGSFYGTTFTGGQFQAGTLFKLDTSNSQSVIHHFTGGADGGFPTAGLITDSAGQLYGTATCGGSSQCIRGAGGSGVVFVQPLSGAYQVLYTFQANGVGGANPNAGMVFSLTGNLYGTTFAGGHSGCNTNGTAGCGVVFKLQPVSHLYTRVYAFTGGADGGNPYAGLILGAGLQMESFEPPKKGACTGACGATMHGGIGGAGVAFQVTPVQ